MPALRFLFVVLLIGAGFGCAEPVALAAAATSDRSIDANQLRVPPSNAPLGEADAPPTYLLVFPSNGFVGVPTHTRPSVEFSEAVTTDSGAFSLECPVGTGIPHMVRSTDQRRWTLEPD